MASTDHRFTSAPGRVAEAGARGPGRATRPKGTGARHVYETIRRDVLSLELPPGADLDEASLVRALGVSRTPVREALIRLSSEGLVVLLPNRGARVAPIDFARVHDFLEALELTQRAVTRWAAARRGEAQLTGMRRLGAAFERHAARRDPDGMNEANRAFHLAIAAACRNVHMQDAYDRLLTEGLRLSRISLVYGSEGSGPPDIDEIVQDHRRMVEAIAKQDLDTAEKLGGEHAKRFRARLLTYLRGSLADGVAV